MSFLRNLFGKTFSPNTSLTLGLADARHPARAQLDEAVRTANEVVQLMTAGDSTMLSTSTETAMTLVHSIDRALERAPGDLDLVLAKSGALACAMQFKTAEDLIDQILSTDPTHFEARQRKDHWHDWHHLFMYPPWAEGKTRLHDIMALHIRHGRSVQLVRDGLQVGVAVVRPADGNFPRGLSNSIRSRWTAVWSETPYGGVVAHYTRLEDDPTDPFTAESLLPIGVPSKALPEAGYWLLQRLSRLNSVFIIVCEGEKAIYNKRFVFPSGLQTSLKEMAQKAAQQAQPLDVPKFQRASQWHMQNFDMKKVRF